MEKNDLNTIDINYLRSSIPEYVYRVADLLISNGFEAFLVGGAVRDSLLKRTPKDFDLATNALPEQIEKIFPRSVTTNARFGTVLVIMDDKEGERFDVEVTTYRKEEEYFGGRWPAKVEFTTSIEEDLSRRDFTINAIAINMSLLHDASAALTEVIIDPFAGFSDLNNKIIRAVRDPLERFSEDGLRSFKACRLAAELEFSIESGTFDAIKQTLHIARKISMERVRDELLKLLKYAPKPSVGINLLKDSGLLEIFLPELIENIGVRQPEWHADDVYTHSLKTLDIAEDGIKLAALLHDLGKARTKMVGEDGSIHFYGHDVVGAEMAKEILTRLKFSRAEVKRVSDLIRWHMFYYPSADWRKTQGDIDPEKDEDGGWTDNAIRRFIKNVGEGLLDDLFKLRVADAEANPKTSFNPAEIQALEKRISEVRAKDLVIKVTDLDIKGEDLISLGITPGPALGNILNQLLDIVIDQPILNKKDELLKIASELLKGNKIVQ